MFLVTVVMVTLNIFVPEQADVIIQSFSKYTDLDAVLLKEKLDFITKFTLDTFSEVYATVKKNFVTDS